ncbi:cadherin repeat domain-containing protein [Thiospirillum jenense]|uniref:Cadherin repeat domain-containing protein n=1 Tax=Thiospirillum jenense TaxID=1653858 RepID=A0A839HBI9_9GAMM|nr:cadherin repeat domain-containing protein [Thiospirillum jenense]MBB1125934.1 cadherin repeat domain-containing protein [Thiospirillum jenense]
MALSNPNVYFTFTTSTPPFTLPADMQANIIDADGAQTINIASGASLSLSSCKGTNDFNIQGESSAFKISRTGSTVTLTDEATGQRIELPATTSVQTIRFADGSATLVIEGAVKFGTQTVDGTATAITTALNAADTSASFFSSSNQTTKSLDALGGTQQLPASFDAGTGAYLLTDTATTPDVVRVTNFGADDKLQLTTATNLLGISSNGTDAVVTINSNGTVSQVTLAGVVPAGSLVYDLTSFNALSVGDITLIGSGGTTNSAPVLNNQTLSVAAGATVGTAVGQVAATDADGSIAGYAILTGNVDVDLDGTKAFAIDTKGTLTVADTQDLVDGGANDPFTLTVQATDNGGATDTGTVTVKVTAATTPTNQLPVVSPASFAVSEDAWTGDWIGDVWATDADGTVVNYAITQGNTDVNLNGTKAFAIDSWGSLTVADPGDLLDGGVNDPFTLTVQATDNAGGVGSGVVTVDVTAQGSGYIDLEALGGNYYSSPAYFDAAAGSFYLSDTWDDNAYEGSWTSISGLGWDDTLELYSVSPVIVYQYGSDVEVYFENSYGVYSQVSLPGIAAGLPANAIYDEYTLGLYSGAVIDVWGGSSQQYIDLEALGGNYYSSPAYFDASSADYYFYDTYDDNSYEGSWTSISGLGWGDTLELYSVSSVNVYQYGDDVEMFFENSNGISSQVSLVGVATGLAAGSIYDVASLESYTGATIFA